MSLPTGWHMSTIGEIGSVVSGGTPSTSDNSNFGEEVPWITPADLTGYTSIFISKGKRGLTNKGLNSSSARLIPGGSVLFSSRAPIGYVAISSNALATNQGFKTLIPDEEVDPKYVYYYLKKSKHLVESMASGTTFKEISGSTFKKIPIPIAPKREQEKIVSKIEELLSELEKGSENQYQVKSLSKVYKSSLLDSAFKSIAQRYPESVSTLGEAYDVYVGATPSRKMSEYWNGQISWASSGEVAFRDITSTREKITELGLSKTSTTVHPEGTVLLAMIGEGKTRGQAAILRIPAAHNQNTAAIRVDTTKNSSEYLYFFLFSEYERTRLLGSGNNQKALNKTRVQGMKIPLPDKKIQEEIVASISSKLSEVEELERGIIENTVRTNSLKQSILSKAFKGELL